jgi:hypothetical protein
MDLYIAWIGKLRNACRSLVKRNLKEKDHFGDIYIDVRIILKWMLNK